MCSFVYFLTKRISTVFANNRKKTVSISVQCTDDSLSINNPYFENYLGKVYPKLFAKLQIKDITESITSASYLYLLLSIGRDGQLHTFNYDKRDDFNIHITNSPFLSSYITSLSAYEVFFSQLIRHDRACSSYKCFILRAMGLSSKLLKPGYMLERLCNRPSGNVMVDTGILFNIWTYLQMIWAYMYVQIRMACQHSLFHYDRKRIEAKYKWFEIIFKSFLHGEVEDIIK